MKPKKKIGRPKKAGPKYVEIGLRVTVNEAELIQRATTSEAARLHTKESRNNFCLRASMAAAKKELEIQ